MRLGYPCRVSDRPVTAGPTAKPSTTLAVVSLTVGILGLFTCGLVAIGALIGLLMGVWALHKAKNSPQTHGGRKQAIAGIALNVIGLVGFGVWLFFALPGKGSSPTMANEAATFGDLRAIQASQLAYSVANGGFFDSPECVTEPKSCIPGYTGPGFDPPPWIFSAKKAGYSRTFHPGPPAADRPATISKSSLQTFAVVAVPFTVGKTGKRAFCADSSGRICSTSDGSAPVVTGGLCPASCETLR